MADRAGGLHQRPGPGVRNAVDGADRPSQGAKGEGTHPYAAPGHAAVGTKVLGYYTPAAVTAHEVIVVIRREEGHRAQVDPPLADDRHAWSAVGVRPGGISPVDAAPGAARRLPAAGVVPDL